MLTERFLHQAILMILGKTHGSQPCPQLGGTFGYQLCALMPVYVGLGAPSWPWMVFFRGDLS